MSDNVIHIGAFARLRTLDDVTAYVADAYRSTTGRSWMNRDGGEPQRLPLDDGNVAALIAHAVKLAGDDGLTTTALRSVFEQVGRERWDRGLKMARDNNLVQTATEPRPNRAGRTQAQAVYRSGVKSNGGA